MKFFANHDSASFWMLVAFIASFPAAGVIYLIWPEQWTRGAGLIILVGGLYLLKRYEHREIMKHLSEQAANPTLGQPLRVLFVCTGNACRSIMAEGLLADKGGERVVAHSAGHTPLGEVHPRSLAALRRRGITLDNPRSKSWEVFAYSEIDCVITLCDSATTAACPDFRGPALRAHWSVVDPYYATGTDEEIQAAFDAVCDTLAAKIDALLALPLDTLSADELQTHLTALEAQHEHACHR